MPSASECAGLLKAELGAESDAPPNGPCSTGPMHQKAVQHDEVWEGERWKGGEMSGSISTWQPKCVG